MPRRKARVDANQSEVVAAFRAAGATVQHLHMVGGGCPDCRAFVLFCKGLDSQDARIVFDVSTHIAMIRTARSLASCESRQPHGAASGPFRYRGQ